MQKQKEEFTFSFGQVDPYLHQFEENATLSKLHKAVRTDTPLNSTP